MKGNNTEVLFIRITNQQAEIIKKIAAIMQRSKSDAARILLFKAINDCFGDGINDIPLEECYKQGAEKFVKMEINKAMRELVK